MTKDQKTRIVRLREHGKGYPEIARVVGMTTSAVRMYCFRNNIVPLEKADGEVCRNCGVALEPKKVGRKSLYCSNRCRIRYWRQEQFLEPKAKHIHTCHHCGKEYFSLQANSKYCTHGCYIIARFGEVVDEA